MRTPVRGVCVLALFAATAGWCCAEPPPVATVVESPAEPESGWFRWPSIPSGPWSPWIGLPEASSVPIPDVEPTCYFPHWYMPVEIYVKGGPLFIIGHGRLTEILKPGMDLEIGAKNYCYDPNRHGAWFGVLGLEFQLNEAISRDNLFVHHDVKDNLDWFFRIYGRIGVGREWYYRGDDIPEAWRYVFGVDVAGLIGHSHAHLRNAPVEQTIPTFGALIEVRRLDLTDFALGATTGAHVGVVIPMSHFDLILAGHLDYQHEWSNLADTDKHLDGILLSVSASVRY
jgi:hypothetical protein